MHAWIPIRNKQKTYLHYALPINATPVPSLISIKFLIPRIPKTDLGSPQIVESDGTLGIAKTSNAAFLYLFYKSKVFTTIRRMFLWCRGSMLDSHAKGLWIKSRSSKHFYFLFTIKYFSSAQISYFHIQISFNNITFQRYTRKNKKFG